MPDDSLIPGRATEKVALNGAVLPSVKSGGPNKAELRTLYLWLCGRIPIPGCSECGRPTELWS